MDHSFSRVHYPVPNPPRSPAGTRAGAARGMDNRRFAAAMAQGRRPDPFRTRKLRPGTAMVLHPEGCGRVARRRTQTSQGGDTTACPLPFSHTRGTTASHHPHPNTEQTGQAGHARRIPYPRTRDTWTRGESHTRTHDPGTPGSKTAHMTRGKIAHVCCSTCLLRAFFLFSSVNVYSLVISIVC